MRPLARTRARPAAAPVAAVLWLALGCVAAAPVTAESQSPHTGGDPPSAEPALHLHHHEGHQAGHPAAEPPAPVADPVWEPAAGPARIANLDIGYTDQSGASGTLANLVDRPVLLTFFYTRCQNSRKCPLTVSRLAALQRRLEAAGLTERVRLLAITYEPRFDTPERLARYATNRGLALGPGARALRLDPERQQALIDDLHVEVAYNSGWVSGHGVELSLLDAGGRLVRKYHAVYWQNPRVVEDLRQLLGRDGEAVGATDQPGGR